MPKLLCSNHIVSFISRRLYCLNYQEPDAKDAVWKTLNFNKGDLRQLNQVCGADGKRKPQYQQLYDEQTHGKGQALPPD